MKYFLLKPDHTNEDAMLDTNILGDSTSHSFYLGGAWYKFMHMVTNSPDSLKKFIVKDERGRILSYEKFLTEIGRLKLIVQ